MNDGLALLREARDKNLELAEALGKRKITRTGQREVVAAERRRAEAEATRLASVIRRYEAAVEALS